MTDIERLLAEALRESGENYEPSDQAEARRRFLERARRRRWYGFAQAAAFVSVGVGAVVFFMYFAGTEETVEPQPEVAGAPEVVATVEVDGKPVSIDAGTGSEVWVAAGGRLIAVDPSTNAKAISADLRTDADEVAVGDGMVWIATDGPTGTISTVNPLTGEDEITPHATVESGDGEEVVWDIAAAEDVLWAVDGVSGRVLGVTESGNIEMPDRDGLTFSDVAAGDDEVWVYDQTLGILIKSSPEPDREFHLRMGSDSDLAVGLGYVWLSAGDGDLVRVDSTSGEEKVLSLGDSYMDLTVHEKSVWALVNVDDENKQLFEINPGTMEVIGEPLEIEGDANDVVAAAGSVWVADGRGEVLRIEPSRDADDPPPPAPEESDPTEDEDASSLMNQVVFVYSQDGDLFAETKNSGSVQLTRTPELEEDPVISPDGRYVLFERHGGADENVLVQLDLKTKEECCFHGDAVEPTIGSKDQIAWVVPGRGSEPDQIAIGRLGSEQTQVYPVAAEDSLPIEVRNLAFDQSMQMLYYEGGYEGSTLWVADLILDSDQMITDLVDPEPVYPRDRDRGAVYTAVSAGTDVNVLLACCRSSEGDSLTEADFGYVTAVAEQDYPYQSVAPVEDYWPLDFDGDLFTGYLGTVGVKDGQDEIEWVDEDKANWLVGDGTRLWVVDITGSVTEVPLEVDGGAAAPNPLHR